MAELIALGGGGGSGWKRYNLAPDVTLILGRGTVDLDIGWDHTISRRHAELRWHDGKLEVRRDPRSRNAIYFQGRDSTYFTVRAGEQFSIGATTFRVWDDGLSQVDASSSNTDDGNASDSILNDVLVESRLVSESAAEARPARLAVEIEPELVNETLDQWRGGQTPARDNEPLAVPAFAVSALEDPDLGKFLGIRHQPMLTSEITLDQECIAIRLLLHSNHVKWDHAEKRGLIDEVLNTTSRARSILGVKFHRLVVFDAVPAIRPDGAFDDSRFLATLHAGIGSAFDLQLDATSFHVEDIFQMLKDEKPSLFCFANFQLVPPVHFRTVRGFTQGVHRVLLLIRGARDIAHEEGLR
jgi:hypothetical protein